MNTFSGRPRRHAMLTPAQYLNLPPEKKADIKETRIIPPRLGETGFGKIEVIYRLPQYEVTDAR